MTIRERTHGKQSRVSRDPIPLFFLSPWRRWLRGGRGGGRDGGRGGRGGGGGDRRARGCGRGHPCPALAPRPAPVLLSSQDAVKTVRDVNQQLRQQSNTINAAQLSNPATPTVITVNFDPVENAQSQEATPFLNNPLIRRLPRILV
jgi:hypothetical protein